MNANIFPIDHGTDVNVKTNSFIQWENRRPIFRMWFPDNETMGAAIRENFSDHRQFATIFTGPNGRRGVQIHGDGRITNTAFVDESGRVITAEEMNAIITNAHHVIYYPARS